MVKICKEVLPSSVLAKYECYMFVSVIKTHMMVSCVRRGMCVYDCMKKKLHKCVFVDFSHLCVVQFGIL